MCEDKGQQFFLSEYTYDNRIMKFRLGLTCYNTKIELKLRNVKNVREKKNILRMIYIEIFNICLQISIC